MTKIIDTVISGRGPSDGKAYFFKGNEYARWQLEVTNRQWD
jgi:hypothetical protein